MKAKLLALFLVAAGSVFAAHWSVGIGIGVPAYGYGYYAPPPPPPVYYAPAPAYRAGYTWVDGYYYPAGPRYVWRGGYYARPPYAGAYWVRPRYYGGRYYAGYWRR